MNKAICPVCNNEVKDGYTTCPACGFKLQGTTEEFEPIEFDGSAGAHPSQPGKSATRASLKVVRGPQIGTTYRLDDKQMEVGRSPHCDIFLNDMTVSRSHAIIRPVDGHFAIRDCQSYNGLWINNESCDEAILKPGDIVQVGAFCLLYSE